MKISILAIVLVTVAVCWNSAQAKHSKKDEAKDVVIVRHRRHPGDLLDLDTKLFNTKDSTRTVFTESRAQPTTILMVPNDSRRGENSRRGEHGRRGQQNRRRGKGHRRGHNRRHQDN